MKVHLLNSDELAGEPLRLWLRMQESDPALSSPYFRPEFTAAVAAVRNDVAVALLEEGGEVAGFFPFQRDAAGDGVPLGGWLSDFHGVVAAPGARIEPPELIRKCGLRSWRFHNLLASQEPFVAFHSARTAAACLDLSGGFAAFIAERRRAGSAQIRKLGTLRRKLEREVGPVRFEAQSDDPGELRRLMEWKSAQYRRTSRPNDWFAVPWIAALLERLQRIRNEGFSGALSVLYAGGEAVAAHFGMRSRRSWHYWFPAYDLRFARYSPGLLLLLEIAAHAAAEGIRRVDLGKGEEPYKRRLANGAVEVAEGRILV